MRKYRVHVDDPHPQSMAASLLLASQLRKQEGEGRVAFRDACLQKVRDEHGELRCHYCGRGGLVPEVPPDATKAEMRMLATLDHVIPRSKGGADRDENNVVVACYTCNQRKADTCGDVAHLGRAHASQA